MADEKEVKQKMIRVTKGDKTVHFMPYSEATHNFLLHQNNTILKQHEQWKLKIALFSQKEMDETPFIDNTYITAEEAVGKVGDLQAEIAALKAEKAALEGQNKTYKSEAERVSDLLSKKSETSATGAAPQNLTQEPSSARTPYVAEPNVGSTETAEEITARLKAEAAASQSAPAKPEFTAEELISKIKDAKTQEEVDSIASKDERVTVINAAKKRIEQLKTV